MKIGLRNFQSIADYVEIELAPITLFFGPNSAGKSTIADALHQLQNIFARKPHRWGQELARHYRKATIPLLSDADYTPEHDLTLALSGNLSFDADTLSSSSEAIFGNQSLAAKDDLFAAEFEPVLYWGNDKLPFSMQLDFEYNGGTPADMHLQSYEVCLEGIPFLEIKKTVMSLNRAHPRFSELAETWRKSIHDDYGLISTASLNDIGQKPHAPDWLRIARVDFNDTSFFSEAELFFSLGWLHKDLPDLESTDFSHFRKFLGLLVLSFNESARAMLAERFRAVPPLRPCLQAPVALPGPSPYFSSRPVEIQSDGYEWFEIARYLRIEIEGGRLPYTRLYNDQPQPLHTRIEHSRNLIAFLNAALSGSDFLNTPYTLFGKLTYTDIMPGDLRQYVSNRQKKRELQVRTWNGVMDILLRDNQNDIDLSIEDVGTGISQVIPVLVAAWISVFHGAVHHIQQPELHLHPKLQAVLADVFIYSANLRSFPSMFLLETHSEHFLLRMLRRIRETHHRIQEGIPEQDSVLWRRGIEMTRDKLSVVYVRKDASGNTQVHNLRLDEEGEFLDRWPGGFFTERDDELFDSAPD